MRLPFAVLALASSFAIIAVTVACGDAPASPSAPSSSSGGDAAPADAAPNDAAPAAPAVDRSELYAAACEYFIACIRPNITPAECIANEKGLVEAFAALPNTISDQTQIDACTATYRHRTSCDGDQGLDCEIPKGVLANGMTCASGAQCASGYCAGATSNQCGKCGAGPKRAFSPKNGPCDLLGTPVGCQADLVCDQGTCHESVKEGGACNPKVLSQCARPLTCVADPADGGTTGTCTAWKVHTAVGDSCDLATADWCSAELECDVKAKKCVARHKAGDPCSFDGGTDDCGRLTCSTEGKCVGDDSPPVTFATCNEGPDAASP